MPSGQTKIKAKAENGQFKNNVKTSQLNILGDLSN